MMPTSNSCSPSSAARRTTCAKPSRNHRKQRTKHAMADTVLKFENPKAAEAGDKKPSVKGFLRRRLRFILLVVVPVVAVVAGLTLYFTGGRYISTDTSYVGAQKVMVTPDVSGRVTRAVVKEGQHVSRGDELFEIDPVPFRLALSQAQSKLQSVRVDFAKLKS